MISLFRGITPHQPVALVWPSVQSLEASRQRRVVAMAAFALIASLVSARLILSYDVLPLIAQAVWLVLLAIAWRPRIGLYLVFALVLLFEPGGPDQLMLPGLYLFGTGIGTSFHVSGTLVTPLELLLVLTFVVWLAKGVASRNLEMRAGRLGRLMLLFAFMLVVGLVWGTMTGGDTYVAFWESRALFYAVICFFLAANTIRTPGHVRTLMALTLLSTGAFAIEGAYRKIALLNTLAIDTIQEFAFSHDSAIFLAVVVLLVVAQAAFGAPRWQRLVGLGLLPIALFTLFASQRRAGVMGLLIAFMALAAVLAITRRKAFFLLIVPLLVSLAVYLPLFWNNTGTIGQPARAVRSLVSPDPRDASSNEYRDLEAINVRATLESNPLLGVGFGRPFEFVVPLPDLSFWQMWHYEPHHNILWVWLKTGGIGFAVFWTLTGSALALAAHHARRQRTSELRTFAVVCIAAIIVSMVFSYVDLGLTSGRVTVLLGTLIGALSVLHQIKEPVNDSRGDGGPYNPDVPTRAGLGLGAAQCRGIGGTEKPC